MLSRRIFSACAVCAIAGFAATEVTAETQNAAAGGLYRTILQKSEFPGDKYATVLVAVDIDAGATVPRHTHPGVESAYILEGDMELAVAGQAARRVKAGDSFQIAAETPHSARNGDKPTKLVITYVVEKDKPLASPAPE